MDLSAIKIYINFIVPFQTEPGPVLFNLLAEFNKILPSSPHVPGRIIGVYWSSLVNNIVRKQTIFVFIVWLQGLDDISINMGINKFEKDNIFV